MPSRSLYLGQDSLLHGLETNVVGSFPPAGDAVTIGVLTLRRPSAMLSGSVTQRFRRPFLASFPLPPSLIDGERPGFVCDDAAEGDASAEHKELPAVSPQGFTKTCSIAFPAAIVSGGGLLCCGPRTAIQRVLHAGLSTGSGRPSGASTIAPLGVN